jgi:hypothetical protein
MYVNATASGAAEQMLPMTMLRARKASFFVSISAGSLL